MSLIVQANQIFSGDIEPVKVIHSIFGVIYVLIHHKSCPLGLSCVPSIQILIILFFLPSYLTDCSIFAENIEKFFCCDLERKVSHKNNAVYLRWQAHL
jgi:hypothetical protein